MILTVAVLGAVLVGLVRGASLRRLGELPFQWGWLALIAFGLQIFLIYFPEARSEGLASPRVWVLALSYLLLVAVVWKNRALPGVWVLGVGLLANFVVMLANGGYMPITPEALAQVGHADKALSSEPGARVLYTKDLVLSRDHTALWWLADVFVLAAPFPYPSVFSPGDLLIAIGAFWLVSHAMRPTT